MLEQFRISDFIEWHEAKTLKLNPDFQRGSVWSPAARILLIDTILRDLPVPKIFIRSKIDRESKRSIREVVDGQQRLRAIIDFANDKITLSKRTGEFSGYRFSNMPEEMQDHFLQYPLAVDQLVNADDRLVLDIFARLNSYNVKLIASELRHAEYQGDFKWSVHSEASKYFSFWDLFSVFSPREMVRMLDDSLVAEMYGVLLEGVQDGGATKIEALYKRYDAEGAFDREETERKFERIIEFIRDQLGGALFNRVLLQPPHLLMLFAAVAHVLEGIPAGSIENMPSRGELPDDLNQVRDRLITLAGILEGEIIPNEYGDFWKASKASTQRIASRRIRFPIYLKAIQKIENV